MVVRGHALKVMCQVSAGIFLRGDLRYSAPFYQAGAFMDENVTDEERKGVATWLYSAALKDCCVGSFMRSFGRIYESPELALMPGAGRHVFTAIEEALYFSTATTECEHKVFKDEVRSSGQGCSRAIAARRMVCRRLQAQHMIRGGCNLSLPLKRKSLKADSQDAGPGTGKRQRVLMLEDKAASMKKEDTVKAPQPETRYGNPKMYYMNQKLHAAAAAFPGQSRAEYARRKAEVIRKWDDSEALRERWTRMWHGLAKAPREARKDEKVLALPDRFEPVWPQTMQQSAQPAAPAASEVLARSPIAPQVLRQYMSEIAKNTEEWKKIQRDSSKFDVLQGLPVPVGRTCTMRDVSGCCTMAHNVCPKMLHDRGLSRPFSALQLGTRRWVDAHKEATMDASMYVLFRSRGSPKAFTLAGIHGVVNNPKVQVFTVCQMVAREADAEGFFQCPRGQKPPTPFILEILQAPPRVCRHSSKPKFTSLRHETSDELCLRLLNKRPDLWEIAILKTKMIPVKPSLRLFQVTAVGDFELLEPPPNAKLATDPAFYSWQRLRRMAPSAAAKQDAAGTEGAEGSTHDDAVEDGKVHEETSPTDGPVLDFMDDLRHEAKLDEAAKAALLTLEDDLKEAEGSEASDGEDDAAALGLEEGAAGGPDVEAVHALTAMDAEHELLGPSASDGSPDWWLTKLGYLYCPRLVPLPRSVAHVGVSSKGDGSLHCTCHLHAKCGKKAGTLTTGFSKYDMIAWALRGSVLPSDAPMEIRRAAGEVHAAMPVGA